MTKIIPLLLLSVIYFSCEKASVAPDVTPEILIYNTSFESELALVNDGWTGTYLLAADASPDGGDSCLVLEPQWLPGLGVAELELPIPTQDGTYRLSFWTKTINWTGSFSVRTDGFEEDPAVLASPLVAEEWTLASHEFTLDNAAESLFISFSAGGTEVATGQVLIDELVLVME